MRQHSTIRLINGRLKISQSPQILLKYYCWWVCGLCDMFMTDPSPAYGMFVWFMCCDYSVRMDMTRDDMNEMPIHRWFCFTERLIGILPSYIYGTDTPYSMHLCTSHVPHGCIVSTAYSKSSTIGCTCCCLMVRWVASITEQLTTDSPMRAISPHCCWSGEAYYSRLFRTNQCYAMLCCDATMVFEISRQWNASRGRKRTVDIELH